MRKTICKKPIRRRNAPSTKRKMLKDAEKTFYQSVRKGKMYEKKSNHATVFIKRGFSCTQHLTHNGF